MTTWSGSAAARLDPLVEQPEFAQEIDDLENWYSHPDRALLLAFDQDLAIGVGALRHHPDGTAEMKRMYVRPVARGSGAADALVRRLLECAAGRRSCVVWLETLRGVMDHAIGLYGRHGFETATASGRTINLPGIVTMERRLETCAPA